MNEILLFSFLMLVIWVFTLASIAIPAQWILGPLERAARRNKQLVQWQVIDILALSFLLALSITLVHWMAGDGQPLPFVYIVDAILASVAILLWWYWSIRLSRARIRRSWHRMVFLAIIAPIAVAGMLMAILLPYVVIRIAQGDFALLVVLVAVGIVFASGGLFTRYMVREATCDNAALQEPVSSAAAPADPWAGDEKEADR